MEHRNADDIELIDRKTSQSICQAVGERLQQTLRLEPTRQSTYLQNLLDEIRRRDDAGDFNSH